MREKKKKQKTKENSADNIFATGTREYVTSYIYRTTRRNRYYTNWMENTRALTELTQKLLNRDVNINKFHGYENEDINCWLEKLELVLDSKGIRLEVPTARTQLINNLAGPAETFMSELPPDERKL